MSILTIIRTHFLRIVMGSISTVFCLYAGLEGYRTYRNWIAAKEILSDLVTVRGHELNRRETEVAQRFVQGKYSTGRISSVYSTTVRYTFKTENGEVYFGSAASKARTSIHDSLFALKVFDKYCILDYAVSHEISDGIPDKTFPVNYKRTNPQLHVPLPVGYLKDMVSPWQRFFLTYTTIAAGIGVLNLGCFYDGLLKQRLLVWLGFPVKKRRRQR